MSNQQSRLFDQDTMKAAVLGKICPYADRLDICEQRHGGDPESVAAHASIVESKHLMRSRIMAYLAGCGPATCDQVEATLGMTHQSASARMSELKRDRLIEPTGDVKPTRSGRNAKVFRVRLEPRDA